MTREELIEQKAKELGQKYFPNECNVWARPNYEAHYVESACKEMIEWADRHPQNLWHDAHGDILPDIEKEVIVLCDDDHGGYKVCFAHRPNKKGYLGKSLVTGNVETFYPHTYGKGGWNIPDVRWWLDIELSNIKEK